MLNLKTILNREFAFLLSISAINVIWINRVSNSIMISMEYLKMKLA